MLYDFFIFYAAKQRVERLRGCYDGDTIAALFLPSLWKKHTMQKNCAAGNLHAAGQIGKTLGFLEADVKDWVDWREENPRYSRAWGWNGSRTPHPHGVPVKGKKS